MKKLIAMIGAVAMSFCAFADEPAAKLGISFETDEPGVSEGTFSPTNVTGWTWAPGDPLELGAYATGELTAAGVYAATGDKVRRDNEFPKVDINLSYLKLDTGTADLTRAMDADAGKGYIDQLVKFTGFEEPQTNLTAGIGVWMSEFVTNEVDDVATTDLTETNLYVTCGLGAEPIALKIDPIAELGDYKLDQWYRLTIKPIGDVFGGADGTTSHAGYIVYINGTKVSSSDPRAKALIDNPDKMTPFAKEAMDHGQLFTAIGSTVDHTVVGFKGVGAIDDIILTAEAPAFTIETVDVTFAPINGAIIASVVDSKGITVKPVGGVYTVNPGALTVTLAAAPGYKMKGTSVYNVNTSTAVEGVITLGVPEDDFVEVVATVTNGSTTNEYVAAELFAAFAALTTGDQVAIVKGCRVTNGVEDVLYIFTSNTTINVTVDGWDVFVGNYVGEAESTADNVGVAAGKVKAFTFEDAEKGQLTIAANINGELIATNGTTTVGANIALGEAALLKAKSIEFGGGRNPYKITLSGAAKVMTTNNAFTAEQIIPGDGDLEVSEEPDADGYYTYQIKTEPPPAEDVVTITIGGQSTGYSSVETALEAVWAAEQDESNYPIVVKATAAGGLTINYNEHTAQIAQNDTIKITKGSWAFSGGLAYKGRIDGAVSATAVTILDGGITLGANGSVTVDEPTALTTGNFSADTGYRVIEDTSVAGKKTFKTEQIPVSNTPGISFETDELGVDGTTFNPSLAAGAWTWNSTEPLEIGNNSGEILPYGGLKPLRRDALFPKRDTNNQYLKLDTGSEELARTMDNANGYVDQLIKFTGYEDIQTNFVAGTKIAVWMGEICTNEETEVEVTATNLYITVGKEVGAGIEQVALKIEGDYKLDTWYRLTVKPIGNIFAGTAGTTPRVGFAVYIDGEKVGSSDPVAKALVDNSDKLSSTARALMENGQLFPAIDATSENYTTVAWKGIGAIDDIILTDVQPEFTIDEYGFMIAPPTGLEVAEVTDKNGNVLTVPYKVAPDNNPVTITFRALPGYKITGSTSLQKTISENNQMITIDESEIDYETIAAYVVGVAGTVTNDYVAAELYAAFAGLALGDKVVIVKNCDVTNGVDTAPIYGFTSNTTIDVAANGWNVFVGNYVGEVKPTTDGDGVAADKIKAFTFEDAENGKLTFSAGIDGELIATNGTTTLAANITLGGAALLKARSLELKNGRNNYTITLSGAARVMTTNNTFTADQIIPGGGELKISELPDEDGYYTYQIAAAPGTYKVTFAQVANGTVETSVTNNIAPGTTVTVTATPDTGYECTEITTNGAAIVGTTFDMPAEDVEVGATFTRQMVTVALPDVEQIEGVSELVVSQKVNEVWEEVTSDPLKIGVGNEYVVVAIPTADYRASNPITNGTAAVGTSITVTEQQVKDKVSKINYVAQVGDVKYETLAEAVDVGGEITLLADVTLNAALTATKDFTLNLAGKTVSGGWSTSYTSVGDRDYLFELGGYTVVVSNGTVSSLMDNIGGFHTVGGNLTFGDKANIATAWRAAGVYDGATLVVSETATLTTAGEDPTIMIWAKNGTTACNVTVNGTVKNTFAGEYTSSNLDAVIMGNGSDQNNGVTLTIGANANVEGTTCAGIYFPCKGNLTVNGTVKGGKFGVYAKAGNITLSGTIEATAEVDNITQYNNGIKGSGHAVVIEKNPSYAEIGTVSISGGKYTSKGAAVVNFGEGAPTGYIEGGLFKGNTIDTALIKPEEHKVAKWVEDATETDYYKPDHEWETFTVMFVRGVDGKTTNKVDNVMYNTKVAPDDIPVIDAVQGYTVAWDEDPTNTVITAAKTFTAVYTPIQYTITYKMPDGETAFTAWATDYVAPTAFTVAAMVALPTEANVDLGDGGTFKGWTNEVGEVKNTAGLTADLVVFANIEKVVDPVIDEITEEVDTTNVPEEKAQDLYNNMKEINTACGDIDKAKAWIAAVYGAGAKIPGLKLANTTAANIALAVANDIPVTANEPTFAVSASTVSADTNVAAFEFTLKDGSDSVEIKTITDKVKAMVRYTSDLATTPFDQATTDEVAVNADPVNGKIKAELKQTTANAGFMKVEPQQPVTP